VQFRGRKPDKELGMIRLEWSWSPIKYDFFACIRTAKNRTTGVLFYLLMGYEGKKSCSASRSAAKFFSKIFYEFRQVNFQSFKDETFKQGNFTISCN
jgi:hypothetical protein